MMEASGEKATGKGKTRLGSGKATLKTLGVSKDEAARAKRLAEFTPEIFERAVSDAKKTGELTDDEAGGETDGRCDR